MENFFKEMKQKCPEIEAAYPDNLPGLVNQPIGTVILSKKTSRVCEAA